MQYLLGAKNLTPNEKTVFRKHLLYMLIEGVILGVLALNEFVFIKSIHGSNYQLGFLFQFSMIVFLFLIFINEFLKRIKNRRKLLRAVGWITRLPLFILLFFPSGEIYYSANNNIYHYIFLTVFLIYFIGNIFIYPNINFLLKNNYNHTNFGKLYGYATSVNKIIMLITTFVYGYYLDINNYAFKYVLPVTSLLGIFSLYVLSSINVENFHVSNKNISLRTGIGNSVKEMIEILRKNVPYRHFEAGFMLYGFSFMISVTVITLYFYNRLNLNYSTVAFYKNSYNILAIILLPVFGKILGKIEPRKFAAFTFATVGLYILSVFLTEWIKYNFNIIGITIYITLIFYIVFHGLFAATMPLLWNIGSSYFCKPEDAGTYQSLHLSLTGLRAIPAPLIGVFLYEHYGFKITFIIAFLFSICASALMIWSWKKDK